MANPTVSSSGYLAYDTAHVSLRRQILRECEEMAEYAFASGLRVPARVMQTVEAAVQASGESDSGDAPYDATGQEIARLTAAHEQLAKVVTPATPRSLVILAEHRDDGSWISFLGPVPLIRHMMALAIASIVAFICLVAVDGIDGNVEINRDGGFVILGNQLFLASAASLGACFAALFQANSYIAQRTYDPLYTVNYWIKYVVGIMAGLMLAIIVAPLLVGEPTPGTAAATDAAAGAAAAPHLVFGRPLLALLGGFSASAVYRILDRLVEAVESLVRGSAKEAVSAAEEQARIRSQGQAEQLRLRMASDLMALQQQIANGGDAAAVQRRLDSLLGTMIPDRTETDDTPAAAPYTLVEPAPVGNGGAFAAGVAGAAIPDVQESANPAAAGAYHGADESGGEEPDTETGPVPTATLAAPVPANLTVSPVRLPADDDDDGAVG